jgi:hypothetical protein
MFDSAALCGPMCLATAGRRRWFRWFRLSFSFSFFAKTAKRVTATHVTPCGFFESGESGANIAGMATCCPSGSSSRRSPGPDRRRSRARGWIAQSSLAQSSLAWRSLARRGAERAPAAASAWTAGALPGRHGPYPRRLNGAAALLVPARSLTGLRPEPKAGTKPTPAMSIGGPTRAGARRILRRRGGDRSLDSSERSAAGRRSARSLASPRGVEPLSPA